MTSHSFTHHCLGGAASSLIGQVSVPGRLRWPLVQQNRADASFLVLTGKGPNDVVVTASSPVTLRFLAL
jgi:hypothetical protein